MKHKLCVLGAAVVALSGVLCAEELSSAVVRKSGDVRVIALPGGATMEMVWCAPGSFEMGSPLDEVGRFENEVRHMVTLTKGFWLGKHEVTQRQWESVMHGNHSKFRNPDNPVETVSWQDCEIFIRRVNAKIGGFARFPTEAEWEYACRAGSDTPFSGGVAPSETAWYDSNSDSHTHEIGSQKPNAWGFYDMHGNVLEWCADWFSPLTAAPATNPKGPPSGAFKVLRGGCWFFFDRDCRSAYRLKREPTLRNCIFGFRMACSDYEDAAAPGGSK